MELDFDNLPQITPVASAPTSTPTTVPEDGLQVSTIAQFPLVETAVAFVGQMQANSKTIEGYRKAGLLIREFTSACLSYTHLLGGNKIITTATTNVQLGRSEKDPTKAALLRTNMSAKLVEELVQTDTPMSDLDKLHAAQEMCFESNPIAAPTSEPHAILLPELSQSWWIAPIGDDADWYQNIVSPLISSGTKYLIITYPGTVKSGPVAISSFYRMGLSVKSDTPIIYDQQLLPGIFGQVLLSKNSSRPSVAAQQIYCLRDIHTAQLLHTGWTLVESTPTIAVWKISTLEQIHASEKNKNQGNETEQS